jgi:hypothetical protein
LMFSGPRAMIGMASGSVLKKVPSIRTGRADYFGATRSCYHNNLFIRPQLQLAAAGVPADESG